ncbi:MAG: hypothetical protein LC687_07445 [Actinobacteria bacterium]|nr:hypothetical protein [Actinomycetota bacterium]
MKPPPIFPDVISRYYVNIDERVAELLKTDRIFKGEFGTALNDIEFEMLELRKKRKTQKLKRLKEEKSEVMDKARIIAMAWHDTQVFHAILLDEDGQWRGKVWTHQGQLEEMELTEGFVRDNLLSRYAWRNRQKKFNSKDFVELKKYDRQQEVDETHFSYVIKKKDRSYILCDINGRYATDIPLSWVRAHLPKEVFSELQEKDPRTRVAIPRGSSSRQSVDPSPISEGDQAIEGPKVHYRNTASQCILKSLASAVHYLGLHQLAFLISQGYNRGYESSTFEKSEAFVKQLLKTHCIGAVFHGMGKKKRRHYCPLNPSCRPNHPILAIIKVLDRTNKEGNINHCVCFVGEYIFDSNRETALPISYESLNMICDSISTGATYAGIYKSRALLIKP